MVWGQNYSFNCNDLIIYNYRYNYFIKELAELPKRIPH